MAVLNYHEISRRATQLGLAHPQFLGVVPFDLNSVQGGSLDVHLGSRFALSKRPKMTHVNLDDKEQVRLVDRVAKERFFVSSEQHFYIHPGDFVLGITREFIALPLDLMAFVEGLSGVGRKGLLIATATQIGPGFHGSVVLELANTGTIPIGIRPGMPIAQLVFQTLVERIDRRRRYRGRHHCQVEP